MRQLGGVMLCSAASHARSAACCSYVFRPIWIRRARRLFCGGRRRLMLFKTCRNRIFDALKLDKFEPLFARLLTKLIALLHVRASHPPTDRYRSDRLCQEPGSLRSKGYRRRRASGQGGWQLRACSCEWPLRLRIAVHRAPSHYPPHRDARLERFPNV
jgi:hypothetical protein